MTGRVGPTRRYHSPRRRAHAQATRRVIIDAARSLFLDRGYSRTSVSAIAALADVAPETVYADFGTKRAILASILQVGLVGPATPVALVDWPELTSLRAELDPVRNIRLIASLHRAIYEPSVPMVGVMRAAADSEPGIAELLRLNQQRRLTGQANMMAHLADAGALRPGLAVEDATDCCWTVASPEAYRLMVHDRGLNPDQYEVWISNTLCRLLLDGPGASGGDGRGGGQRESWPRSKQHSNGQEAVAEFLERAVTTWTRTKRHP
jgi:AcrR family transcriptional regulator